MSRPLTQDLSLIQKELSSPHWLAGALQELSFPHWLAGTLHELSSPRWLAGALQKLLYIMTDPSHFATNLWIYILTTVLHTFSFLIAFIFWNIFRFSRIFVRYPHLSSIFWESFVLQNPCMPDNTLQCAIERWCVASGHQAKNSSRQQSLNLYGSWHISPTLNYLYTKPTI